MCVRRCVWSSKVYSGEQSACCRHVFHGHLSCYAQCTLYTDVEHRYNLQYRMACEKLKLLYSYSDTHINFGIFISCKFVCKMELVRMNLNQSKFLKLSDRTIWILFSYVDLHVRTAHVSHCSMHTLLLYEQIKSTVEHIQILLRYHRIHMIRAWNKYEVVHASVCNLCRPTMLDCASWLTRASACKHEPWTSNGAKSCINMYFVVA